MSRFADVVWSAFVSDGASPIRGVFVEWRIRWSFDGDRLSIAKMLHNTDAQLAALRINGQLSPRRRKGSRDGGTSNPVPAL